MENIDYSKEIVALEKLFDTLQQNVYFLIGTIIGILSLSLVIAGWALSVLARKWVDDRVKIEMEELKQDNNRFKDNINDTVIEILKKNKQVEFGAGSILVRDGRTSIFWGKRFLQDKFVIIQLFSPDGMFIPHKHLYNEGPDGGILIENLKEYEGQMLSYFIQWTNK